MEVQRYGALNAAMQSKYATEQSLILHGTATRDGIILDFYMRVSHMHNNILGLLSCISVTHYPCNQGMLPAGFLESELRCFSFLVKSVSFRRSIWLHSWHLYHNHSTKMVFQGQMSKSDRATQTAFSNVD